MVFSSLIFLFRFLPAVLLLYFVSPRRLRNPVLLVMSLLFVLVPSLTSSTSFMILPSGALAIGIAYLKFKKTAKGN